jgi:hypothetical protein
MVLATVLGSGCQPASSTVETVGNYSSNAGCYQVEFLGVTESSEVASTWRYHVQEGSCAQQSSNWILELPSCATVVDASPAHWELIGPDMQSQISGIKWQTGSGFQDGEFSVTLTGNLQKGMTRAGVEGQNISIGSMEGPVCQDPVVQASPASVPIARVKVQSANCRARPVGKSNKVVILYRNQEAQILGRSEDPNNPWWYVKIPDRDGNCWLWGKTATTDGDVAGLPIVK